MNASGAVGVYGTTNSGQGIGGCAARECYRERSLAAIGVGDDGFVQALPGKITMLTDVAFTQEEVDVTSTRTEIAAAGFHATAAARENVKIDLDTAKLKVAGAT